MFTKLFSCHQWILSTIFRISDFCILDSDFCLLFL